MTFLILLIYLFSIGNCSNDPIIDTFESDGLQYLCSLPDIFIWDGRNMHTKDKKQVTIFKLVNYTNEVEKFYRICRENDLISFLTLGFAKSTTCRPHNDDIINDNATYNIESCYVVDNEIGKRQHICDLKEIIINGDFKRSLITTDFRDIFASQDKYQYLIVQGTIYINGRIIYTGSFKNNKPIICN